MGGGGIIAVNLAQSIETQGRLTHPVHSSNSATKFNSTYNFTSESAGFLQSNGSRVLSCLSPCHAPLRHPPLPLISCSKMRLKHLESALSSVPVKRFPDPKIELEQYATSPHLTAAVILTALGNGDIGPGRTAMDLGCGTAMLTIGCGIVETDHITAVDCDADAMEVARSNVMEMLGDDDEDDDGDEDGTACSPPVEFVFAKVVHESNQEFLLEALGGGRGGRGRGRGRGGDRRKGGRGGRGRGGGGGGGRGRGRSAPPPATAAGRSRSDKGDQSDGLPFRDNCVDTVLTNPPFGTKQNAGIDITFLRAATRMARRAVYSFNKTSTREYLTKKIKQWGYRVEVVAQMRYDIPKMYHFHTQDSVDVEVDLIRVIIDDDDDR